MAKELWTFGKDELLIELVRSEPGLYDFQSPHYSDNSYKKRIWDEIEQTAELTGAKVRWESLRAQYRKYLAKLKTKSGQPSTKICKWRYCDQMQFLNDHLTVDKPRITSIKEEEIDNEYVGSGYSEIVVEEAKPLIQNNDNEEIVSIHDCNSVHQSASGSVNNTSATQTKKIKRNIANSEGIASTLVKYILENKKSERQLDSIDQFFALMATTVKKFSLVDQHVAKTQVFFLINKMEEKYLGSSPIVSPPAATHHSQTSPDASSD